MTIIDETAFIIFAISVAFYVIIISISFRRKIPTKQNLLREIYYDWVENRLKGENLLYPLHALRNFMMGNSTFISAFFILLGILVGFYSSGLFSNEPFFGNTIITVGLMQMTVNIVVIVFIIFNFTLSIRSITRLSLLISGNPQNYTMGEYKGIEITRKSFLSAKNHWMIAIRALFYLISTLLWFVNAIFFIIASILITLYLVAFHDIKLF